MVSIIILTYNRFEMFRKCISAVLKTTSGVDKEIIIWDNDSEDETKIFIEKLSKENSFIISFFSNENIGVNAKSKSFEMAKGDYIVCIDDDVISLPDGWVDKMINAFKNSPDLGYLSLDVIQDEHTGGAKYPENAYTEKTLDGDIILQFGPAGGWCFMIPRYVYEKVGKLRQMKNNIFFGEDGDYNMRCALKGYKSAILKGIKCYHATGPYYNMNYNSIFNEKMKNWNSSDFDYHKFKYYLIRGIIKIKKFFKGIKIL
jgi:GT2 family glycosyltransferase